MNLELQQVGQVAAGGTILNIAEAADGTLWLASPAGLFCQDGQSWRSQTVPLARVGTILAAGKTLWAGGIDGTLWRSHSKGERWLRCLIEQTDAPITSLAASPNYQTDRVLLAGTTDKGILRSTNGGKHFELVNFGLESLAIFDLAVASVWSARHEFAFAITGDGVYWSPNGGRGWRKAIVDAMMQPVTIAVSPHFGEDSTVYVGCHGGEVLVSADKGRTFTQLTDLSKPITTLTCITNDTLLIGTVADVTRLATNGEHLSTTASDEEAICLHASSGNAYVGTLRGLRKSADHGQTWQTANNLAARRFIWFETPSVDCWFVAGPDEGVFCSNDQGASWRSVWTNSDILSVYTKGEQLWIGTPEGIYLSENQGTSWASVLNQPTITAILKTDAALWSGDHQAHIWRNGMAIKTPFAGADLLGLYGDHQAVIASVWRSDAKVTQLWLTGNEGRNWQRVFAETTKRIIPQVGGGLVGIGRKLYQQTRSGWQSVETPSPIVSIIASGKQTFIVQSDQIALFENGTLTPIPVALDKHHIAAASIQDGKLLICSTTGQLWHSTIGF